MCTLNGVCLGFDFGKQQVLYQTKRRCMQIEKERKKKQIYRQQRKKIATAITAAHTSKLAELSSKWRTLLPFIRETHSKQVVIYLFLLTFLQIIEQNFMWFFLSLDNCCALGFVDTYFFGFKFKKKLNTQNCVVFLFSLFLWHQKDRFSLTVYYTTHCNRMQMGEKDH